MYITLSLALLLLAAVSVVFSALAIWHLRKKGGWARLRSIGSMKLMSAVIIFPFLGQYIVLSDYTKGLFSVDCGIVRIGSKTDDKEQCREGTSDKNTASQSIKNSQTPGTDASRETEKDSLGFDERIYILYLGLLFLGVGQLLFAVFAIGIYRRYPGGIEYINDSYTGITLHRFINYLKNNSKVFVEDPTYLQRWVGELVSALGIDGKYRKLLCGDDWKKELESDTRLQEYYFQNEQFRKQASSVMYNCFHETWARSKKYRFKRLAAVATLYTFGIVFIGALSLNTFIDVISIMIGS